MHSNKKKENHSLWSEKNWNKLTNSATATACVTGHDRSLTSKMTGWGAVMTGPDRSHTSKMTGWGAVGDQSHTSKMTGQ